MKGRPLDVSIVFGREAGACDAGCGMDWSLPENMAAARDEASRKFGPAVALSFCDLSSGAECVSVELMQRISRGSTMLPLLLIGGEARIEGYFDIRMLSDVVEAALETRDE